MKPVADMREGPAAFTTFQNAIRKILSVPRETILKREAEYKRRAEANPNRRGPKRKKSGDHGPAAESHS
jgi:hypothetical protein